MQWLHVDRQRALLGAFLVAVVPVVVVLAGRVTPAETGPLVINEVMASNRTIVSDEDGDHGDWIELRNLGDRPVGVGGYYLSDDDDDPLRWRLPERTVEPGGYLLIWASGKDRAGPAGELHTDFRIDRSGEPILLTETDGRTTADRLDPVAIPRDVSFGRHPVDPNQLCFFPEPTPGVENPGDCRASISVDPPTLSAATGYHHRPFHLSLTAPEPDEPIFYTTDGSYPDPLGNPEATREYDGPILIEDRSPQPNRLADITAISPEWSGTEGPVQKATVVRARTGHGQEAVATYFVGPGMRPSGLPVVSIATDPDHLFDHDTGIYVMGAVHEAGGDGPDLEVPQPPANFFERGRAWERPAEDDLARSIVLTYCDAGGDCDLTTNVGLRIHGGATRSFPQKSLRLYARNAYGDRTIDHAFFGDRGPRAHRRLILRNSGNDWGRTMFLDAYLQTLAGHLATDTQAYQPAVLFINGEYWGIHNIRERYDRHYLGVTHGVDPDAVVIVDPGHEVNTGSEGDEEPFLDLLAFLDDHDPSDEAALAHVERLVDVENLIDYLILQIFVANTDWPQSNIKYWRERVEPDGAKAGARDGRWRWLTYDLDHAGVDPQRRGDPGADRRLIADLDSLSRVAMRPDEREEGTGIPFLLSSLLENEAFREQFLSTFADHLNTTFLPARTLPYLEQLESLLEAEMEMHSQRWNRPASTDEWREEVDRLRSFMSRRPDEQRRHIVDFFGLEGTVPVGVQADQRRGYVSVNTLDLVEGTPGVVSPSSWEGVYFRGVPLTVTATPRPGYRFVRWEGTEAASASERTLRITPDGPVRLRAVFAPA